MTKDYISLKYLEVLSTLTNPRCATGIGIVTLVIPLV